MISLVPSPHCVHLQRQSWKPLVICGEVTVIFGLARPMSAPPLGGEAHTTFLPLPEPAHRGLKRTSQPICATKIFIPSLGQKVTDENQHAGVLSWKSWAAYSRSRADMKLCVKLFKCYFHLNLHVIINFRLQGILLQVAQSFCK